MKLHFRILLFGLIALWLFISLSPLFNTGDDIFIMLSPILKISFSTVCHQETPKLICNEIICSFLCSRCTGIYFGALIISLFTLIKPKLKQFSIVYLLIGALPMFLDVILVAAGFYNYSKLIAFFTGMIFGSIAFYYFYIGIQDFSFFKTKVK